MDLPREIMSDIFSRLSIKSIFCCKTVCKFWYNILTSDSLFFYMYYKRSSSDLPSLLLSIHCAVRLLVELKAVDFHPIKRAIVLSHMFHLPSPKSSSFMRVIGSCNGFICLLNGRRYDENPSVFINNPLLGEYFEVKLSKREKRIRATYAFCFSEASGQYKVLRSVVSNPDEHLQVSELEVYTLGVDKWRYVGKAPEPIYESFSNANVNGVVHWMNLREKDRIYSFNSLTEEVKSLLAPRGLKTSPDCLTLVELGSCLCLSDETKYEYIDIWWMKVYGIAESWTKQRILKDSIQPDIRYDRFIPISTWKDGEILMRRDRGTHVVSYDPKEKKFTKVKAYGEFEATSFFPSFYSLKNIIGERFQVSYAYPKIEIV